MKSFEIRFTSYQIFAEFSRNRSNKKNSLPRSASFRLNSAQVSSLNKMDTEDQPWFQGPFPTKRLEICKFEPLEMNITPTDILVHISRNKDFPGRRKKLICIQDTSDDIKSSTVNPK